MPKRIAPWYRTAARRWYVNIDGTQTPLPVTDPGDEAGAWDALKRLVNKAIDERVEPRPKVRRERIAALVPEFLASLDDRDEPPTDRTKAQYGCQLMRFDALHGSTALINLCPKDVQRAAAQQGWSDSHRANYLWTAQAFMRWAGRGDFKLNRPAKESRGVEAVIPDDVYALILRETKGDFYQLMRLLWQAGTRVMESGGLTAEMVHWPSGTITLKQHKTKRHKARRVVYLTAEALEILKEQSDKYGGTGALFRGLLGQPLSMQAVMTRMIRLSARIGHHVTAGHFRHTFATRALARGVPDTHVAALLGHTSTRMVHQHYGHINGDARLLREAAERVNSAADDGQKKAA